MIRTKQSHSFDFAPTVNAERSVFDRSSVHKTTFNAGWLIPVFHDEVLPGDTYTLSGRFFARLASALKQPMMDNLYLDMQAYFVPYRLVWDKWEKFQGQRDNPTDDPDDYLLPHCDYGPEDSIGVHDLESYFGLPIFDAGDIPAGQTFRVGNTLPLRCYDKIYDDHYRHQKLEGVTFTRQRDDSNVPADFTLRRRMKRHDFFTSALPTPQEGAGVMLPLGTTAPVYGDGQAMMLKDVNQGEVFRSVLNHPSGDYYPYFGDDTVAPIGTVGSATTWVSQSHKLGFPEKGDSRPSTLYADLSTATAATINTLRLAFAMQRYAETLMRSGNRYVEQLAAIWQVTCPDFRLQRSELLATVSFPLNSHVVPQTAPAVTGGKTLGDVAAFSTGSGGISFVKSFVEHGHIIILASVRADMVYQQNVHKMWSRRTRYDLYQPPFAHLGEQPVLTKELYWRPDAISGGETVFGYQEYGAEYRYKNSMVTGMFRSAYSLSLDSWHLSQDYGDTYPELNTSWMSEDPPIDRILTVASTTGAPQIIYDSAWSLRCARRMPVYSIPGELDHH